MLLVNKKKLNMNKSLKIGFFQILIFFGFALENGFAQEIKLWPEIEPYYTDYLKVSDIHELYYELSGNPTGKPVFVLHGGPGGGCSPYMRRYFNPEKYHIILHDQRGAGKSMPRVFHKGSAQISTPFYKGRKKPGCSDMRQCKSAEG